MATYNGAKYIREQVASILAQLGESDELIVSDDGSTDGTLSVLREFGDARIQIFPHISKPAHPFYRVTQNFENALAHASGDFLFFSDQDDVWLPNKIQTLLPHLQEDCFVWSDAWMTNEKLEKQNKLSEIWNLKRKGFWKLLARSTQLGCVCAFTKSIKEAAMPFPPATACHDQWVRLVAELQFKTKYIDEPLILYRRHTGNTSDMHKSPNSLTFKLKYRLAMLLGAAKKLAGPKA
jgi:glycosyltransferase involved in cell wall biosynthesis